MSTHAHGGYFIPEYSKLPIVAAFGMFTLLFGAVNIIHFNYAFGSYVFFFGALVMAAVMYSWFHTVIKEDQAGVYEAQMDRSYRWGMFWFIFSEVCFFGAFFGALFYARLEILPTLAGTSATDYSSPLTHLMLWPNFKDVWPLFINPNNAIFVGAKSTLDTWSIPALNTAILLTSGVTVTWAHWAIKKNNRLQFIIGLALTILLGALFLYMQAHEYIEAYTEHGLKLTSGIYGTTFFMLTGFHGAHVTIGATILFFVLLRAIRGHFTAEEHFGFEAAAWYWHFVDVVWLFLFVFVYWL